LQILIRVERDGAYADVLLGRRLRGFMPADRGLITQLVLGTIAWQGRLDFELSHHSASELGELVPAVRAALRMGLFQTRILSRIPQHAAVDTAVSLTRELAGGRQAGFVNAVLRNTIRRPVALPPRSTDETEYLALAYSHPRWLVEKFTGWFGQSGAEALMAANNEPAANVLRLNMGRATAVDSMACLARDGMTGARPGRFPETVILNGPPVMGETWHAGLFQIQGEASQLVARLLAPPAGSFVVDCAAAPGGKATHLAELIGAAGKVLALDLKLPGLVNTRSAAARLGHRNVLVALADTSLAMPLRPRCAGYVLLDAPCTGLGTLREHPEIRWRLHESDFERMATLQRRMLEQAAAVVAAQGVLVYAVCSIAPAEGREVINAFLAENPDFVLDPPPAQLSGLLVDGYLQTRPDIDGSDGFFAARLKRRS
jgi:16S rRNA (cytosine967-C5)-methyltransferase